MRPLRVRRMVASLPTALTCCLSTAYSRELMVLPCGRRFCQTQPGCCWAGEIVEKTMIRHMPPAKGATEEHTSLRIRLTTTMEADTSGESSGFQKAEL